MLKISVFSKKNFIKFLNNFDFFVCSINLPALGKINAFMLKNLHRSVINPFSIALGPSEQKIKAALGF